MKRKITLILALLLIPLLILAKSGIYERYDEDVESLFNVLLHYDRHDEVFEFIMDHANIGGPHIGVFKKIVKDQILSYTIVENHYMNGFGMYYIHVRTKRDFDGEYFWIQCSEDGMEFIY